MSHWYDNGRGGKYPSVTTILQEMVPEPYGITKWKAKNQNWEAELKRKGVIGTVTHYRILKKFSSGSIQLPEIKASDFPDDLNECVEMAEIIFGKLKLEACPPFFPEYTVLCHKYEYAGQLDLIATLKNPKYEITGTILIDLKTSNAVHDNYAMQLAGYRHAFEEMHPKTKIDGAAIINLCPYKDKNPNYEPKITFFPNDKLDKEFDKFITYVEGYKERRKVSGKVLNETNNEENLPLEG